MKVFYAILHSFFKMAYLWERQSVSMCSPRREARSRCTRKVLLGI